MDSNETEVVRLDEAEAALYDAAKQYVVVPTLPHQRALRQAALTYAYAVRLYAGTEGPG